jgi:two-component system chemotaxis response regulator CheY
MRILIVDDSRYMRKVVGLGLSQAGVRSKEIVEAENGSVALNYLQDNIVDLILCDIDMPVMDGLEFVKQLSGLANAKDVPVVMITSDGCEASVTQALACGARGYIRKPFTPEDMQRHVLPFLAEKSSKP